MELDLDRRIVHWEAQRRGVARESRGCLEPGEPSRMGEDEPSIGRADPSWKVTQAVASTQIVALRGKLAIVP